jgi:hypothetical protein
MDVKTAAVEAPDLLKRQVDYAKSVSGAFGDDRPAVFSALLVAQLLKGRVFSSSGRAKALRPEGLTNALSQLVDSGFFFQPKGVEQAAEELLRRGFHPPRTSVNKLLFDTFMKRRGMLTRNKEGGVWKYRLALP